MAQKPSPDDTPVYRKSQVRDSPRVEGKAFDATCTYAWQKEIDGTERDPVSKADKNGWAQ
jgi:hypothetical protein